MTVPFEVLTVLSILEVENWPHPVRSEHNNKPVTTSKSWFYANHECYNYRLVEDIIYFLYGHGKNILVSMSLCMKE